MQWDIMRGAFDAERHDARPHRRPEAGDLRLPGRRRARLPQGEGDGAVQVDARRQLAQRRRAARTPTTHCSTAPSSAKPASPTARSAPPPPNVEPRLLGAPVAAPLRVRVVHAADGLVPTYQQKVQSAPRSAGPHRPRPRRTDVSSCSRPGRRSSTRRQRRHREPRHAAPRPHRRAGPVQQAGDDRLRRPAARRACPRSSAGRARCSRRGRPGSGSACSRRSSARRRVTGRRSAALTQFIGWTAEQVATRTTRSAGRISTGGCTAGRRCCATRASPRSTRRSVRARRARPGCCARPAGERFMTDLRHIAQLLHEAAVTEGVGPTAMANWLGRRIHEADRDAENEERTRRLESDAAGRAGDHDPPEQGTGVPRRLVPLRLGRLGHSRSTSRSSTTPTTRTSAPSTSGARRLRASPSTEDARRQRSGARTCACSTSR